MGLFTKETGNTDDSSGADACLLADVTVGQLPRLQEAGDLALVEATGACHLLERHQVGLGRQLRAEHGVMLVVTRAYTDYLAPARLEDELIVDVALTRARRASIDLEQNVRHRDGQVLCRADVRAAGLRAAHRLSCLWTGLLRKRLEDAEAVVLIAALEVSADTEDPPLDLMLPLIIHGDQDVRDAVHRLLASWDLDEVQIKGGRLVAAGDSKRLGQALLKGILVDMEVLAHAYDRRRDLTVGVRERYFWVGGADNAPRCPYCHDALEENVDVSSCGGCHTLIHPDCFAENQGCPILGCGARGAEPVGKINL